MPALAIDIVLLPPERISELAMRANQELLKKNPTSYMLNRKDRLAHISLCMGTLEERDIPQVLEILKAIAKARAPLELMVTNAYPHMISDGRIISSWELAPSANLRALHEEIVRKLAPLLNQTTLSEPVWADKQVTQGSRQILQEYTRLHSFNNFRPHIILGFGETRQLGSPIRFTAAHLALCHVGDMNSCRRIIAELVLQPKH